MFFNIFLLILFILSGNIEVDDTTSFEDIYYSWVENIRLFSPVLSVLAGRNSSRVSVLAGRDSSRVSVLAGRTPAGFLYLQVGLLQGFCTRR